MGAVEPFKKRAALDEKASTPFLLSLSKCSEFRLSSDMLAMDMVPIYSGKVKQNFTLFLDNLFSGSYHLCTY